MTIELWILVISFATIAVSMIDFFVFFPRESGITDDFIPFIPSIVCLVIFVVSVVVAGMTLNALIFSGTL